MRQDRTAWGVLFLVLTACRGAGVAGPEVDPPSVEAPAVAVRAEPGPAPDAGEVEESCEALTPDLTVCPDQTTLDAWGAAHHVAEPTEATLAPDLTPPDPVEIRDGLVVYEELLSGIARESRTHLELFTNTPVYTETEVQQFRANPALWEAAVAFRLASPQQQIRKLRTAFKGHKHKLLRAMLLRGGYFYLESPTVARYASRYIGLHHMFDADQLLLRRAGRDFVLRKGERGKYVHFDPPLDEAYASVHLLDWVGATSDQPALPSYELQTLRRKHGLSNIVVGEETPHGRPVEAKFFDGTAVPGLIALDGEPQLALLGELSALRTVLARSLTERKTMCSLLSTADTFVNQRLDFDEPKVEYGQQDGRLRWRFMKAYDAKQDAYWFNGVRYPVYGDDGKPRVPQLCVDFVYDAVNRLQGTWWRDKGDLTPRVKNGFDIRNYARFRTVRNLIALARQPSHVASIQSLPREEQIPYKKRAAFFDNLWRHRDDIREGDVLVIYGKRPDNQLHYHSFYVRETDPIHGVPTVIAANPGFARVQSWHDVMWESPRRSIRHIIRWNTDWLTSPFSVDAADGVIEAAQGLSAGIAAQTAPPDDSGEQE